MVAATWGLGMVNFQAISWENQISAELETWWSSWLSYRLSEIHSHHEAWRKNQRKFPFGLWVVPNNPADDQVMEEVGRTLRSIFVRMVGKVGKLPTPWMEPGGLETQSGCNAETLSVAPLAACELHSSSNLNPA